MTPQQKNRIKALFLLMVFSWNTLAGFACSVGVDLGYNAHHHEYGKSNHHAHGKSHHKHHHHNNIEVAANFTNTNDDCCSHEVAKFALLDKAVSENNIHLQVPVFLLAFASTFLLQIIHESGVAVNSKFQFVRRSCFLNDIDLRIAIQSFQI
jgi:hypothetical protein